MLKHLPKYRIAQNFDGKNFCGSTHPDIWRKITLADGNNKSFLLVHTELIFAWLHGNDIYLYLYFSVES